MKRKKGKRAGRGGEEEEEEKEDDEEEQEVEKKQVEHTGTGGRRGEEMLSRASIYTVRMVVGINKLRTIVGTHARTWILVSLLLLLFTSEICC